MGCIIKIGNNSVSETDFLNHLNKIISINKLFEENPNFSSQIYEALAFKDISKQEELLTVEEKQIPGKEGESFSEMQRRVIQNINIKKRLEIAAKNNIVQGKSYSFLELKKIFNNDKLFDNEIYQQLNTILQSSNLSFKFGSLNKGKLTINAYYNSNNNSINIDTLVLQTFDFKRILLHEIIHAATFINLGENAILTATQKTALNNLNNLILELKKDRDFFAQYGLTNVNELLAELANEQFVDKLKKKTFSDNQSFFEKIISEIVKLLGLKTTAYDIVKESFDNLVKEYNVTTRITPQQKQQAQQLYSQYLEQNPNGSVEQFKSWVNNKNNFDKELAQKIQDILQRLYPEIKLNITNNPVWEQGDNVFNQDLLDSESKNNIFKLTENVKKANRLFDILSVKNKMSILTTANVVIENNPLKYLHVSNTGIVTLNIQLLSKDIRKELGNDIIPEKVLKEASNWSENINDTTEIEKQFVKYKQQIEDEKLYYESLLKDLFNLDNKSSSELFNILVNTSVYFNNKDIYQSFSLKGKDGNIFTYQYKNGNPRKKNEYDNFILLKKISQGKRGTVINHEAFNNEDLEIEANLALQEFKKDKERIKKAINKLLIENIEHSLERTKSNLNSETFKSDYIRDAINMRYEQVQMNEEDIIIWGVENLIINNLIANGVINEYNELSKPFGFVSNKLLELTQNKEYQELKEKQKKINYILNNKEKFNNEYDNFETDDSDLLAPIPEWFLNAVSVANTGKYFNEHKGFVAGMVKGIIYLDAQKQYDNLYDNGLTPYFQTLVSTKNINDLIVNKINFVNTFNLSNDLAILNQKDKNKIIGQANIKAMTVLIDAVNQKQDTLPHEYAHHYIAWFRNTPIVQEAIKKWGSEEALVQSIGEQVVKQKGEAYNWWSKFVKWIMNQFNSLSKLQKEELTQILTDAFLTRQILGSKKDIEGFKEFVSGETTKEEAPPFYEMSAEEREERFQDFYNKNQNISEDEAREYFNRCML